MDANAVVKGLAAERTIKRLERVSKKYAKAAKRQLKKSKRQDARVEKLNKSGDDSIIAALKRIAKARHELAIGLQEISDAYLETARTL